jgi:tetratricopeptide (TPR) repeat protein
LQERIRDRYGQVVTLAGLAELDRCAGRLDSALKGASAAIDIARDIDEVSNLVAACNVRAAVLRSRGRTAEALAACREGLTRARASGNDFAQVEALTATALCETGRSMMDIPGAVRTARQAVVLARRAGYHLLEGKALTALAELHLAADRPALARRFAQRAVAHHRHNGYRPGQIQALALLAFAEPDLKAANAHVDAARALARAGGLVVLPEWGDWNA